MARVPLARPMGARARSEATLRRARELNGSRGRPRTAPSRRPLLTQEMSPDRFGRNEPGEIVLGGWNEPLISERSACSTDQRLAVRAWFGSRSGDHANPCAGARPVLR